MYIYIFSLKYHKSKYNRITFNDNALDHINFEWVSNALDISCTRRDRRPHATRAFYPLNSVHRLISSPSILGTILKWLFTLSMHVLKCRMCMLCEWSLNNACVCACNINLDWMLRCVNGTTRVCVRVECAWWEFGRLCVYICMTLVWLCVCVCHKARFRVCVLCACGRDVLLVYKFLSINVCMTVKWTLNKH